MSESMVNCFQTQHQHFLASQVASVPEAVRHLQQAGVEAFSHLGLPTRRMEAWKYTPLTALAQHTFDLPEPAQKTLSDDELARLDMVLPSHDAIQLVFVNGFYDESLSSPACHSDDLILCSLATAWQRYPDKVVSYLLQQQDPEKYFSALNQAFLQDGVFCWVAKNHSVEKPIHCMFVATGRAKMCLLNVRNVIVLESGANVSLFESYLATTSECYLSNVQTQVHLGANANMKHVKSQSESLSAFHIGIVHATLAPDSALDAYSLSFGGGLTRSDSYIALSGAGATVGLYGLYMVQNKQHVDHHTIIEHQVPHCTSHENYRGILAGQATGVFNGRVHVHPHAQKTQSSQENKNLLLSSMAQVNTKPELEIYADDIQCTHGATVGQLDKTVLFYLQSRGLNRQQAMHLLTTAFAREITDKLPHPLLQRYAKEHINTQLMRTSVPKEYA